MLGGRLAGPGSSAQLGLLTSLTNSSQLWVAARPGLACTASIDCTYRELQLAGRTICKVECPASQTASMCSL